MWNSWFVFGFVQLGTNRWFKHFSRNFLIVHALSGILITGLTLFWVLKIIIKFEAMYFDRIHNVFGFIVLCMVCLVAIGGISLGYAKKNTQWNTKKIRVIKLAHKVFGLLVWLLGAVAITLGIAAYTEFYRNDLEYLVYLNAAAIVVIFLAGEGYY